MMHHQFSNDFGNNFLFNQIHFHNVVGVQKKKGEMQVQRLFSLHTAQIYYFFHVLAI